MNSDPDLLNVETIRFRCCVSVRSQSLSVYTAFFLSAVFILTLCMIEGGKVSLPFFSSSCYTPLIKDKQEKKRVYIYTSYMHRTTQRDGKISRVGLKGSLNFNFTIFLFNKEG